MRILWIDDEIDLLRPFIYLLQQDGYEVKTATSGEDGVKFPPPTFNLTSALHHVCGGMSFTFECSHGLKEPEYAQVNHDQILDIQLILYDELLKFALANPVRWKRDL